MRAQMRKRKNWTGLLTIALVFLVGLWAGTRLWSDGAPRSLADGADLSSWEKLQVIRHSRAYPEELVSFAEHYDQVVDFVYYYPVLKDERPDIDLTAEASGEAVPLLMQWDSRWGYLPYGDALIGCAGCGPVCLSMAALYLTGDPAWTPAAVSEMAVEQGYCVPGQGSSWTLISEGCEEVGLRAEVLPLSEAKMKASLEAGSLIILVVGPGDFTRSGHFLVVTGCSDSGFFLNDPNSRENSTRTWTYEELSGQIRNLWALSPA